MVWRYSKRNETLDFPKSLVNFCRNSRTKLSEEIERRKKEATIIESEDLKRIRVANEKNKIVLLILNYFI